MRGDKLHYPFKFEILQLSRRRFDKQPNRIGGHIYIVEEEDTVECADCFACPRIWVAHKGPVAHWEGKKGSSTLEM